MPHSAFSGAAFGLLFSGILSATSPPTFAAALPLPLSIMASGLLPRESACSIPPRLPSTPSAIHPRRSSTRTAIMDAATDHPRPPDSRQALARARKHRDCPNGSRRTPQASFHHLPLLNPFAVSATALAAIGMRWTYRSQLPKAPMGASRAPCAHFPSPSTSPFPPSWLLPFVPCTLSQ